MRLILSMIFLLLLSGCSERREMTEARQPIDFTVVENREIPEALLELIEKNKADEIRLSYTDGEDLYLVRGYGEQKTGGYSISVTECAEDTDTIWLNTRLLGPERQEKLSKESSYPYLVIKMEGREKEAMIT